MACGTKLVGILCVALVSLCVVTGQRQECLIFPPGECPPEFPTHDCSSDEECYEKYPEYKLDQKCCPNYCNIRVCDKPVITAELPKR